ncbi:DMT family transporter [Pseudohongiella spirulinae]|uniref:Putative membrane protein n=1 Tax=Pseudohongiella spirulinae TaxID=1249552 RepID=A0A0S2K923_9GAMM|nr:DMT family transporter [Pseudohongiella spirulinae]ALO44810.1 Putative membrane protein [Pseudohongiella spirulinae]
MPATRTAWLQIHLCVILWGFTAILGKLITMQALPLVIWRMGLVAICLLMLPSIWRKLSQLTPRLIVAFSGIGALVAMHWLTFYGAIKLANASVAVTCIATVPVFLSVIEPLLAGRRFQLRELLLGLMVLPGIILVVGGTPENMNNGIVMGIVSALFVALFASLNKRYVLKADALTVTALEMAIGCLFLLLLSLLFSISDISAINGIVDEPLAVLRPPQGGDLFWVLTLALACTLLPFALSLVALRQLSAYASALAVNLEPIYAIVLAALLLGEQQELSPGFYLGAGIIIAVVLIYPWLMRPARHDRGKPAT